MILSIQACSFKKNGANTASGADTASRALPATTEARFDWQDDLNPQNQNFVKAKRSLVFTDSVSAASDEVVTLPQTVPSPLLISVDNQTFNANALSFSKVYAVTSEMKTELKVTTTFAAGIINFKVELLPAVLSQATSQKIQLELDLFGTDDRIISYLFYLRTPPAALTFQPKGISELASNAFGIPSGLMHQVVNGVDMNLISVVNVTNNESDAVEITLPQKLNGVVNQALTSDVYSYLGDCEGTYGHDWYWNNYSYSSNATTQALSSDVYLVPYDEYTIQNLYLFSSGNSTQTFSVKDIDGSASLLYLVYAKGPQLQSWENRTAFHSTIHTISHQPTKCFANEGNSSWDQIEYADFQVGELRGQPYLHFNESLNALARYLDLDELKEEGNRSLPLNTSDISLIGG